ncbi:type II toxin-antitoxin system toxin DNA ADP-ribosyl transferase DarT [Terrimonas ferruginea]|uniref:type II toxin-antitoxin system toxin DNA ADP-ribosyl transferase DarT n=1 Tax=Terrimonas ferruginea TaxID=249 RepID=UPI000400A1DB|nr:DUF4433 domain-containing protein [Terrimonas ferruginea]
MVFQRLPECENELYIVDLNSKFANILSFTVPQYDKIYLYRITHIGNLPHIIRFGITHNSSVNANPSFISIGDGSLISSRNQFMLKNGKLLGDYIPFYFGVRMPMLYVVQRGYNMVNSVSAPEIVYCVTSLQRILKVGLPFIFTDGHAVSSLSDQYDQTNIKEIETILDKNAIDAKYWKDEADLDLKRRKEAEFLVLGDIPYSAIAGFLVYNEAAKSKLKEYGVDETKIQVKATAYF